MRGDTQLVEAVCVAALNLQDPAQRKIFLDRACGDDERLREAINAMLADIVAADEFFPTVASSTCDLDREAAAVIKGTGDEICFDAEPDELSRKFIGRYKL